jgi:integrase/recombinase XerD
VTAPLPAVAEEYVSWLTVERGRAPSTIAAYRRDLAGFSDYLAARGRTLEMATAAEVESYLASMQRSHLASATVARLASVLHGLYGFLLDEGIIDVDPTSLVAPRHAATRLPVVLSESQVAELLASPSTDAAIDVRDRAVLELLYGTGVRVSELVGLDLGDVDFDEELVRVTGKGSKQRLVPLGRGARDALVAWLDGGARATILESARQVSDARGGGRAGRPPGA